MTSAPLHWWLWCVGWVPGHAVSWLSKHNYFCKRLDPAHVTLDTDRSVLIHRSVDRIKVRYTPFCWLYTSVDSYISLEILIKHLIESLFHNRRTDNTTLFLRMNQHILLKVILLHVWLLKCFYGNGTAPESISVKSQPSCVLLLGKEKSKRNECFIFDAIFAEPIRFIHGHVIPCQT